MVYFSQKLIGVLLMASKRGPLSKAEVFYITEHAKLSADINQLANDLDRPIKAIEKVYTKAVKSQTQNPNDQFVRHKGATIMTENASSISDARRGHKSLKTAKTSKCVTKIKNNE